MIKFFDLEVTKGCGEGFKASIDAFELEPHQLDKLRVDDIYEILEMGGEYCVRDGKVIVTYCESLGTLEPGHSTSCYALELSKYDIDFEAIAAAIQKELDSLARWYP